LYKKLFTFDNLRMKNDEWFIDKTEFALEVKTSEICIGKSLSWERLSQLFPEVIFTEPRTNEFVMKLDGLTFVKLKDDDEISDKEEYFVESQDENGYWLLDIKTGKRICESLLRKKGKTKINKYLP
jgi:hypothetical protein